MATLLFWLIVIVAVWLVYRFVARRFPAEPPPAEHPLVPSRLKHGPGSRSSAVALDEPDDDHV